MSTVTESNAAPAGAVVAPVAPAGEAPKKPRKPRTQKKEYQVPEGGFQSSDTPGFDVETMKQLRESNFADTLDFAKWRVWYFKERLRNAQQEVSDIEASGATPEERKAAQRELQLIRQLEKIHKDRLSKGNVQGNSKLAERVGALFSKIST